MIACLGEIAHKLQRYETVGDWMVNPLSGEVKILVSKMDDPDYRFLVQAHELIEVYFCLKRGISEQSVTDFDLEYEARRPEGDVSEPGDDPKAPYHKEHIFATKIERLLAEELRVDWDEYDRTVGEL